MAVIPRARRGPLAEGPRLPGLLAGRLPGDGRAERGDGPDRGRVLGGDDALGQLAGRAVRDADGRELGPALGLDERRDPPAVGGEDGVGGGVVRELAELARPAVADPLHPEALVAP